MNKTFSDNMTYFIITYFGSAHECDLRMIQAISRGRFVLCSVSYDSLLHSVLSFHLFACREQGCRSDPSCHWKNESVSHFHSALLVHL